MDIRNLVGAGDRVMLVALPFAVGGIVLNLAFPDWFAVGGPGLPAFWAGVLLTAVGLVGWAWSVFLVVTQVPKGRLITTGPFKVVLHPLYLSIGLLALPGIGLLLDTWVGFPIGAGLWLGVRLFGAKEEKALEESFGEEYKRYRRTVWMKWQ